MDELTCCGFGHRLLLTDMETPLRETLERLVAERGVTVFCTGGMGEFDELFARTVRSLKRNAPQLRLVLVMPYFTGELTAEKEFYETRYDEILIPAELDGVHPKAAIGLRNRWMVDHSDIVVAALHRDSGGAAAAVRYAEARGTEVLYLQHRTGIVYETGLAIKRHEDGGPEKRLP